MSIAHPDPTPTPLKTTTQKVAYNQALQDFSLTDLLTQLQNFSSPEFDKSITEPESELIAAVLVKQLANSISSQLISAYLKAIRQGNREIVPEPISLEYLESTALPAGLTQIAHLNTRASSRGAVPTLHLEVLRKS